MVGLQLLGGELQAHLLGSSQKEDFDLIVVTAVLSISFVTPYSGKEWESFGSLSNLLLYDS